MEWCLIALTAGEWAVSIGQNALTLITVALGLGMVIFVHELGHFAVAKWCGVKCEKFYLGFDIYGKKLFHFTRGETEYGIGILPLGGYVKMLGQDDNPSRQAQERERSTQTPGEDAAPAAASAAEAAPRLDPRSYLAMSVPKRMAIISAGVIMNVIFAIVVFMIAHLVGFRYMPASIAAVSPGLPAWVIGIEPGDDVIEIGGKPARSFENILQEVMFAKNTELVIKVRRADPEAPGGFRELEFRTKPDEGERRLIGVGPPRSVRLASEPVVKYSPADSVASLKFRAGDEILAVNDVPVTTYAECARELARHAGQPVSFKVRQKPETKSGDAKSSEEAKEVSIPVAPWPVKTLGLITALDKIQAIKVGSPAEKAGLQKDDLLVQMNGEPIGDPMTFPERIRRLHGQAVKLLVQRGNDQKELLVVPTDRPALPDLFHSPTLDIPAIGAAYKVLNRVEKIAPGSPAAEAADPSFAGKLVSAEIIPDPKDEKAVEAEQRTDKLFGLKGGSSVFKFGDEGPDQVSWPLFCHRVQRAAPGSKVKITLEKNQEATLTPEASNEFFLADRGLTFDVLTGIRQTSDPVEAFQLSVGHTLETSTMIYRFLQRLGDWKVSKNAGGPVGIAQVAWSVASAGLIEFLMFLGMLSVNLAVINFLPIPVLDGGHMVFLAYEGIRGKPADERITERLHLAGLALLLCLILFVFCLDGMRLLDLL